VLVGVFFRNMFVMFGGVQMMAMRDLGVMRRLFMINYLGLHDATDLLLRFARWPLLIVIIIFGLAVLLPLRAQPL
jgi:hypothetical protein